MTDSGNNPRAASSKGDDTTTLQQERVSKPDRIDHGLKKNDTHPRSGKPQKRAAFQQFTETQSARGIPLRGGPPGTVNPIATPTEQHAAMATASTIPPSTQKQGPSSLTTDPEEEAEFDEHAWPASEMQSATLLASPFLADYDVRGWYMQMVEKLTKGEIGMFVALKDRLERRVRHLRNVD